MFVWLPGGEDVGFVDTVVAARSSWFEAMERRESPRGLLASSGSPLDAPWRQGPRFENYSSGRFHWRADGTSPSRMLTFAGSGRGVREMIARVAGRLRARKRARGRSCVRAFAAISMGRRDGGNGGEGGDEDRDRAGGPGARITIAISQPLRSHGHRFRLRKAMLPSKRALPRRSRAGPEEPAREFTGCVPVLSRPPSASPVMRGNVASPVVGLATSVGPDQGRKLSSRMSPSGVPPFVASRAIAV